MQPTKFKLYVDEGEVEILRDALAAYITYCRKAEAAGTFRLGFWNRKRKAALRLLKRL